MKNKFARWEKLRVKGKWNYIIKYGMLYFGLMMAVLVSFINPLILGGDISISRIIMSFILFPLAGIGWGAITWWNMERKYSRQDRTESTD